MKRAICTALLFLLILSALPAQVGQPINEEALQAFSISFQAYVTGGMMSRYQPEMPGFSLTFNGPEVTVVFDRWDLSLLQLEESYGYRTISGTIVSTESENGSDMIADLTFEGGPVQKLQWSVDDYEMSMDSSVVFQITADGDSFSLSYSDFMIQTQ